MLFDKGKVKIPDEKAPLSGRNPAGSKREPCRGSGILEITIEAPATKPDGSTASGKPLAVPKLHCNSREAFGYKLYIDLMILRFFPK